MRADPHLAAPDSVPEPSERPRPAPVSLADWDSRYPGILDGAGVAAGIANVIMALSLPPIGRGVLESRVDSGSVFRRPFKRTRTTLTYLGVATLGSSEEKAAFREAVNTVHHRVYSTAESPVEYHAMNPQLQLWVAMCLAWGMVDTWQKFRGPVGRTTLNHAYRDLAVMGTTLQVQPEMWPRDAEAFEKVWQEGLSHLSMDPEVRHLALAIAGLEFLGRWVGALGGPLSRWFTAGFLPAPVRRELGWDWTEARQARFDRTMRLLGRFNSLLPRLARTAGIQLVTWDLRRRLAKGLPLI